MDSQTTPLSKAPSAPPNPPRQDDLTKGSIPGHIRAIAVPASVGFFFHTMYNVVDTYFAGRLSTQALAALSLSFPLFFIIIALGNGLSVGGTAVIGGALGAGERRKAGQLAAQGLTLAAVSAAALTAVGLWSSPWLFGQLGAKGQYLALCRNYLDTIFWGSASFVFVFMLNGILVSHGQARPYRNFLVASFFANVALDPWFVFGGLGVPAMGVRGIALATVIIEACGALYLLHQVRKRQYLQGSTWRSFVPRAGPLKEIAHQALPAGFNSATIGLGIFVITYFHQMFGEAAVAAYGIATRVEQIVLLPTIGLTTATLSMAAQNNGAGRIGRIRRTVAKALTYGGVMMAAGGVGVFVLASPLMVFFTGDAAVVELGSHYLRIASFIFFAYVILFTNQSALQGMKQPLVAMCIGIARQVVAPVLIFWTCTHVLGLGLPSVWWGILGITWTAAVVAHLAAKRVMRAKFLRN